MDGRHLEAVGGGRGGSVLSRESVDPRLGLAGSVHTRRSFHCGGGSSDYRRDGQEVLHI